MVCKKPWPGNFQITAVYLKLSVYLQHGAASYVDIWEQSTVWIPHLTARALEILLLTT